MFYEYNGRRPTVGRDSYVSDIAHIIGDVTIGDNCYVGHGSILRGDYGSIVVGNGTPCYKTISMELMKLDRRGPMARIKSSLKHRDPWGTVHGGALASLVDSTSGLSTSPHLKDGETIMTISLQVDYFAPAVKGNVIARGRMVHRSKRLARAEAVIEDEQKNLIAKGQAMYMIFSAKNDQRKS